MSDVFVSYSRDDQPTARRVADGLTTAGFSVWWDQALRSGEAFDRVTEKALEEARAVVVLWSKSSVESRWVRAEATQADRNGTLLPVTIEPCKRPIMFELTHTPDLSGWQGDTNDSRWRSFVDDVRTFIGKPTEVPGTLPGTSAPIKSAPARRVINWRGFAIAIAALALVGAGIWAWIGHGTKAPAAATRTGPVTIAVLPFADMSTGKDQEAFADGMSEEILNSLARIQDLQVTGRTSSFFFKGKNESFKTIGEALGVDHLLEGSIRKDGDKLRITAQLVKANDGFHLWSQTFDRPMKDIFKVQEDIARAVADALQVTLGVGEIGQIPGMTRDYEAYEAWMESRITTAGTADAGIRAIEKLKVAVKRDPNFAKAWLDLGAVYGLLSSLSGDPAQVAELRRLSEAAARTGRELAPDSADVRMSEAGDNISDGRWSEAGRRLRAIEKEMQQSTNPLDPTQYYRLAVAVDRAQIVLAQLEQERDRDPLSSGASILLSLAYASTGRLSEAYEEHDRYLKIVPDEISLFGTLMLARAMQDEERTELNWKRLADVTSDPQDIVLRLYALRDRPADARAEFRRFVAANPSFPASRIALWAAYFDDDELALQAFRDDKDLQRRFVSAITLWRPIMADMRKLAGFKDLMRDWGFVDYWKEFGWGEHCKPVGDADFECH